MRVEVSLSKRGGCYCKMRWDFQAYTGKWIAAKRVSSIGRRRKEEPARGVETGE